LDGLTDLYETCETEADEQRMRVTVSPSIHGRSNFDRFSDTRIPLSDLILRAPAGHIVDFQQAIGFLDHFLMSQLRNQHAAGPAGLLFTIAKHRYPWVGYGSRIFTRSDASRPKDLRIHAGIVFRRDGSLESCGLARPTHELHPIGLRP